MAKDRNVELSTGYKIGRGEMKYEVFQILKEAKEKADPGIQKLANDILEAVELKIQKL
jgi:hypothetical protein